MALNLNDEEATSIRKPLVKLPVCGSWRLEWLGRANIPGLDENTIHVDDSIHSFSGAAFVDNFSY